MASPKAADDVSGSDVPRTLRVRRQPWRPGRGTHVRATDDWTVHWDDFRRRYGAQGTFASVAFDAVLRGRSGTAERCGGQAESGNCI
jgi:hypothetical protein